MQRRSLYLFVCGLLLFIDCSANETPDAVVIGEPDGEGLSQINGKEMRSTNYSRDSASRLLVPKLSDLVSGERQLGVCVDTCRDIGSYPKCPQCPKFVASDSTPGVMDWKELLEHMDALVEWGQNDLKGWRSRVERRLDGELEEFEDEGKAVEEDGEIAEEDEEKSSTQQRRRNAISRVDGLHLDHVQLGEAFGAEQVDKQIQTPDANEVEDFIFVEDDLNDGILLHAHEQLKRMEEEKKEYEAHSTEQMLKRWIEERAELQRERNGG